MCTKKIIINYIVYFLNMKNKLISFILLFCFLLGLKFFFLPIYAPFDIKLREFLFKLHTPSSASEAVVIIDIDSKTLETLGQWPFSRLKFSQVLYNLSAAGAGIIGVDIVFSSEDRTSPHQMAKSLNIQGDFQNSDEVFANIISNTPTILGYYYDFQASSTQSPPSSPAIFTKVNFSNQNTLRQASGVIGNIEPIKSAAYSSGFFNVLGLQTGLVDKVELLLNYEGQVYPALAFEMVRIASQSNTVNLFYNASGLEGIGLETGDIKTDIHSGINLNYRGPAHSYKYISFLDIYTKNFNPKEVEGKFVLIGTSDLGLHDILPSLYDAGLPGVEVHATIIDNLLNNDYLYTPSYHELIEVLLLIFYTLILGLIYNLISARMSLVFSILIFFSSLYLNYWLMFSLNQIYNFFLPLLALVLSTLMFSFQAYQREQKQKSLIKNSFSKKVSADVVEELLHQDINTLKSQKKEISIFFSDIRNFTKISERLEDPQRLIRFLNAYLEPMSEEIIEAKGTIDKFIGDAIMAYWNAPLDLDKHADIAVKCAIKQLQLLKELNVSLQEEFNEKIEIGIGINTNEVIVAEIGSIGRSDYTVIGDAVNLASRCEGLCKFYGVQLIITQYTRAQLSEKFLLRELDTIKVVGKEKPVTIFEVIYDEKRIPVNEIKVYEKALSSYKKGHFQEALKGFEELRSSSSLLYTIYIQRCQDYIKNPPLHFDAVYEATQK
ncbi:MAG: adenylate/guanylate cyclase domain-containing protein [Arcobacter sp.]|nr:MAG: adenylate/guanylate cyclase domain-containing protein [Arcobacter sp.]